MVTLADGLSGGEVAGLIVAVFWAVLVCFIGYVLIKLGNVVGETGKLVAGVTDETVPLLTEVRTSVGDTESAEWTIAIGTTAAISTASML